MDIRSSVPGDPPREVTLHKRVPRSRYSRTVTALTLPTQHWGDPSADRRALLLHGLSSSGATWWRVAEALAADGWSVTAVDLRGHGTAPAGDHYAVADYASDLPGFGWDLVIGHSLGGAVAVVAALQPGFADRVILLDPALYVPDEDWEAVRAEQLSELTLTEQSLRSSQVPWTERDIAIKLDAVHHATAAMIEGTLDDNHPWSVLDSLPELTVPTLILTGDPAVFTMLPPEIADAAVAANPLVEYQVIPGAAHSPHREQPELTLAAIRDWLA